MSGITKAQATEQLAVFNNLDLSQPMTTSQVRRKMAEKLGYKPGYHWTERRMRERGVLLSREEALELVRCPVHGLWMNLECAVCSGKVIRCKKGPRSAIDEDCYMPVDASCEGCPKYEGR